jgi:PAS domain-containing protein
LNVNPRGKRDDAQAGANDVTERQRAAVVNESRRRMEAVFENALDAMLLADDEGRYVDADAGSQAGYTLLSSGPVIVEDLRVETRFAAPSLLIDPSLS